MQRARCEAFLAELTAVNSKVAKMPMIAITVNNSTKVNAALLRFARIDLHVSLIVNLIPMAAGQKHPPPFFRDPAQPNLHNFGWQNDLWFRVNRHGQEPVIAQRREESRRRISIGVGEVRP